jgi:hypothetical protein|tara:strand:+ start:3210 stop:3524 length:315 start_codon:yes stop_codon:yes gene_type:complete
MQLHQMGDSFAVMRINGFLAVTGALVLALALVLLLTPVSSNFADPCGSVLVPTKVHYSDGGEMVHANTPPCRDARMARLPFGLVVGVAGIAVGVASVVSGRRRG